MGFQKGDFVLVTLETKEKYKGQIVEILKNEYLVEICINQRKSEPNETELVAVKKERIEAIPLVF